MTDREQVIAALEICAAGTNSCDKCPMKDSCHGVSNAAMVAAIKLLKQEPVIVQQREMMHMLFWCCGSCGAPITEGDKFCRMCGKPVKWDG